MEKLEVLSHVEVAHSDDLTDVGKLLRLRKLGVILQGKKEELELLFQQVEKLYGCLRSLSIQMDQQTKSQSGKIGLTLDCSDKGPPIASH